MQYVFSDFVSMWMWGYCYAYAYYVHVQQGIRGKVVNCLSSSVVSKNYKISSSTHLSNTQQICRCQQETGFSITHKCHIFLATPTYYWSYYAFCWCTQLAYRNMLVKVINKHMPVVATGCSHTSLCRLTQMQCVGGVYALKISSLDHQCCPVPTLG